MSIVDTFDAESAEIISPYRIIDRIEGFPETVVVVFTQHFEDLVLNTFESEQITTLSAGRAIPVYAINYGGQRLGFYHTLLGGAGSASLLEETFALGAERVLFFGSCGSLDKSITGGHLLVPTAAYRDEGTSYHYATACDYMAVQTADRLANVLDDLAVPHIKTKIWTTDGFYRETFGNIAARRQDGCAAVDMECASIMAVGQYRCRDVYEFLYTADCLDGNAWDRRILGNMPQDMREQILHIALETAIRLG